MPEDHKDKNHHVNLVADIYDLLFQKSNLVRGFIHAFNDKVLPLDPSLDVSLDTGVKLINAAENASGAGSTGGLAKHCEELLRGLVTHLKESIAFKFQAQVDSAAATCISTRFAEHLPGGRLVASDPEVIKQVAASDVVDTADPIQKACLMKNFVANCTLVALKNMDLVYIAAARLEIQMNSVEGIQALEATEFVNKAAFICIVNCCST